jgi:hypothetical protein
MIGLRSPLAVVILSCAALAGCAAEPLAPDATFVLHGSGHAPPADPGVKSPQSNHGGTLNPVSLAVGLYALSLSASADCSAPVVVEDHGAAPAIVDFMASPLLFSGSPPDGDYACVMLRMSDVIHFQPDGSDGDCAAGIDYTSDIYREGESDWRNEQGKFVVGHGSDRDPVDDGVTLFLTTDPRAVLQRGMSLHQTLALGAPLSVPGSSTFYWDGTGSVGSAAGECGIDPGSPTFR